MALNSLHCTEVPLRNCSLTHSSKPSMLRVRMSNLEFPTDIKTKSSAIAVIADRTACSILTLYSLWSQHLDLWIQKSVRCQSADPTITADLRPQADASARRLRSPHTSAALSDHRPTVYGTRWVCHCWQTSRAYSIRMPETLMAFLTSFFVVHFVSKRHILQQKCMKEQIGTGLLETRWCNF